MKEKLRKEETTVFIGVSIALLEIISGREAVMKYNGTKAPFRRSFCLQT